MTREALRDAVEWAILHFDLDCCDGRAEVRARLAALLALGKLDKAYATAVVELADEAGVAGPLAAHVARWATAPGSCDDPGAVGCEGKAAAVVDTTTMGRG